MKDIREYREREYELIEEIEDAAAELKWKLAKLKREVDFTICEAEVEHFLQYGSGGTDPK